MELHQLLHKENRFDVVNLTVAGECKSYVWGLHPKRISGSQQYRHGKLGVHDIQNIISEVRGLRGPFVLVNKLSDHSGHPEHNLIPFILEARVRA